MERKKKTRKTLQSKRTIEEKDKYTSRNFRLDYFAGRCGEGEGDVCRLTGRPNQTSCFFLSSHNLKTFEIHAIQ